MEPPQNNDGDPMYEGATMDGTNQNGHIGKPGIAGCDDSSREVSSPPCMMHEVDDVYAGYLGRDELIALLNLLLEGERAGARAAAACRSSSDGPVRTAFREIATDEAWSCAMLSRHIEALGGAPSTATGAFLGKLLAITGTRERLAFLNRGQAWVVRKLRDALPRVRDDLLREELGDMLALHEANIERCERLLSG